MRHAACGGTRGRCGAQAAAAVRRATCCRLPQQRVRPTHAPTCSRCLRCRRCDAVQRRNTVQHVAAQRSTTRCNALQHAATPYGRDATRHAASQHITALRTALARDTNTRATNAPQRRTAARQPRAAAQCDVSQRVATQRDALPCNTTRCNAARQVAMQHNTWQRSATRCHLRRPTSRARRASPVPEPTRPSSLGAKTRCAHVLCVHVCARARRRACACV